MRINPFFKWAGGKTQLLPVLFSEYSRLSTTAYAEPFLGGGALLLSVLSGLQPLSLFDQSKPTIERVLANDANPVLINLWTLIRDDLPSVLASLTHYQQIYNSLSTPTSQCAFYNDIKTLFNSDQKRHSMEYLFLNKTSFNGLYRVNKKGEFNVGWNKATTIQFDFDNLARVSSLIQSVEFSCRSFDEGEIIPNGFYYLDPPYKPISTTSSFNRYFGDFSDTDQVAVKTFCDQLDNAGAYFMVSNSDCDFFRSLYSDYRIKPIMANRAINCNSAKRGAITELLIMNF